MRIGIIGSGVAGLTCGWLAQRAGHQVTIFERQPAIGMDAHSIHLPAWADDVRVDVPPRMFNADEWPRLTQLYQTLGVASQPVDATKSFADADGAVWLTLGESYTAGLKSLLNSKARKVAADTLRLKEAVSHESLAELPIDQTLDVFLTAGGYSDEFVYEFLFPGLAATVLTCSYAALKKYPAKIALQSLLNQVDQSPLMRTTLGTRDVVQRLSAKIDDVRLNTTVVGIEAVSGEGLDAIESVRVHCEGQPTELFDQLVIATQANSAARLVSDDAAWQRERTILETFQYEDVPVVVHTDDSLLPGKSSDRDCFNFISQAGSSDAMCTIWLNRFYPEWKFDRNVYQTIRPWREPDPATVIATAAMQRPVVTARSVDAVAQLRSLCEEFAARRRVWFCGSYAAPTVPLLESGVASAHTIAHHLSFGPASELLTR